MNITGSASVTGHTIDVEFTQAQIDGVGNTAGIDAQDSLKATINVSSLSQIGDTVTATYTIINNEPDLNADVTAGTITGANQYFSVTATGVTGMTVDRLFSKYEFVVAYKDKRREVIENTILLVVACLYIMLIFCQF